MKKIELQDQKRKGLFPEHKKVATAMHEKVRLTIPAREALEAAGATVAPEQMDMAIGMPTYTVRLGDQVPIGLVAAHTKASYPGGGWRELLSLRMEIEPEYPGEFEGDYWQRLDFVACPKCGAPLVWYEAGYVPGYRVCAKTPNHHWLAGR